MRINNAVQIQKSFQHFALVAICNVDLKNGHPLGGNVID